MLFVGKQTNVQIPFAQGRSNQLTEYYWKHCVALLLCLYAPGANRPLDKTREMKYHAILHLCFGQLKQFLQQQQQQQQAIIV